jgi:hypothetical protein
MAGPYGFNFRGTSGFVTDAADTTYVIGDGGTDNYPQTRNGITFGWVSPVGSLAKGDRSAVADPRLAGVNAVGNGVGAVYAFRVDLPVAGAWQLNAAFGDLNNGQTAIVTIKDGTTAFATINAVDTALGSFADVNGTVWTAANWVTSNTSLLRFFGGTTLFIEIGDITGVHGNDTCINHLFLTKVEAVFPGAGSITMAGLAPTSIGGPDPVQGSFGQWDKELRIGGWW